MVSAAIIVLVWTNALHHLVFADFFIIDEGPFPMLGLVHGPVWWLIVAYHYFLVVVLTIVLLYQMVIGSGFQRHQAGVCLAAVLFIWIANAVYISGKSPVSNMDISSIAFTLVAASLAWGFFRYNLLDITPIARSEIFQGLDDAILVLDEMNRVVDFNPAACSLFGIRRDQTVGQDASVMLRGRLDLKNLVKEHKPVEICLKEKGRDHTFDLRVSTLKDKSGKMLGRIIVLRDMTESKRAEAEKERLIARLQESLKEVKTLRGILPICSSCKKNRDDKGYWN